MIKCKTKKKKVNDSSNEYNTNQKKGSIPQDENKTKKKKKQYDRGMEMGG